MAGALSSFSHMLSLVEQAGRRSGNSTGWDLRTGAERSAHWSAAVSFNLSVTVQLQSAGLPHAFDGSRVAITGELGCPCFNDPLQKFSQRLHTVVIRWLCFCYNFLKTISFISLAVIYISGVSYANSYSSTNRLLDPGYNFCPNTP